jgi:hypothetical protein
MAQKPRKPLTHKISDNPSNRDALEQARSAINSANKQFRRVIEGVLVTEEEYLEWRDNGGARGNR